MKKQHDLYANNLVGDTVLRLMPESSISILIAKRKTHKVSPSKEEKWQQLGRVSLRVGTGR